MSHTSLVDHQRIPKFGRINPSVFRIIRVVLVSVAIVFSALPGAAAAAGPGLTPDCDPDEVPLEWRQSCIKARLAEGQRLFEEETFGGNGRTCETCHSKRTGTFSPADVRRRLQVDPFDPLFVHDGLDDGFSGTSRIEEHATVRITLPLPDHLELLDDPFETEVTMNRGTPTTRNTPALDNGLMYDFRNPDLESQALGAIQGHAQNTLEPTALELELIAEFQRSDSRFFSDGRMRKWARTGTPPDLPEGTTESEKRGRAFFVDAPFNPPSKQGVCALCHSGPFLDRTNVHAGPVFRAPPGSRPFSVGVSERNKLNNPEYTFLVHDGQLDQNGQPKPPVEVTTPDIGILMTDLGVLVGQNIIPPPGFLPVLGVRLAFFANRFKTPTLWGVQRTAPYFHDNSAKDLDEMLEQYDWFFENPDFAFNGSIVLTEQDKEDIKAFLKLL